MVGSQKARDYLQPDYGRVHQELRHKGITLMLLWEEQRADYTNCRARGVGFCMRVEKAGHTGFACVRDFLRSGEDERIVTLAAGPGATPTTTIARRPCRR